MTGAASESAAALREALVAELVAGGQIVSPAVEGAFRRVPRHAFVPDVPLADAYADRSIPRLSRDGQLISSVSQPAIVAIMLEQLAVKPGQRVLEIGAGMGYNAALLAELVGPHGHVTAVEIEPELAGQAERHLAREGYENVQIVCGDGGHGHPPNAPYDRIILTVGAGDITPAWWTQLRTGGLLVLPIALAGLQLSVAFEKADTQMHSRSARRCGFVLLQGEYAEPLVYRLDLAGGAALEFVAPPSVDAQTAEGWLQSPGPATSIAPAWTVPGAWMDLWLWLALHEPHAARLVAPLAEDAPGAEIFASLFGIGPPLNVRVSIAVVGPEGLALLTGPPKEPGPILDARPAAGPDQPVGLFVRQFGQGQWAARRLQALVERWDAAGRPGAANLEVLARLAGTDGQPLGGLPVRKTHTDFWLRWQASDSRARR